jgi:LPXTG-motif cell wall-anchored protein
MKKRSTTNLVVLGGLVALGVFLARRKKATAAVAPPVVAPKPTPTGNYVLV